MAPTGAGSSAAGAASTSMTPKRSALDALLDHLELAGTLEPAMAANKLQEALKVYREICAGGGSLTSGVLTASHLAAFVNAHGHMAFPWQTPSMEAQMYSDNRLVKEEGRRTAQRSTTGTSSAAAAPAAVSTAAARVEPSEQQDAEDDALTNCRKGIVAFVQALREPDRASIFHELLDYPESISAMLYAVLNRAEVDGLEELLLDICATSEVGKGTFFSAVDRVAFHFSKNLAPHQATINQLTHLVVEGLQRFHPPEIPTAEGTQEPLSVTVVGSLPVAKYESDLVDSAKGSRDGEETDDYHYPTIQLPLNGMTDRLVSLLGWGEAGGHMDGLLSCLGMIIEYYDHKTVRRTFKAGLSKFAEVENYDQLAGWTGMMGRLFAFAETIPGKAGQLRTKRVDEFCERAMFCLEPQVAKEVHQVILDVLDMPGTQLQLQRCSKAAREGLKESLEALQPTYMAADGQNAQMLACINRVQEVLSFANFTEVAAALSDVEHADAATAGEEGAGGDKGD